eukprot:TRINITY_DN58125_c0_g1_i1.p1 TRINITY_DN58125_c0_g1~~TRINITY_DN58125_c0_g1_i1.p1  ORF type:complete len:337 (+),score=64.93 TRINITY_DN58125_c0_g1_i1:49-1011(+)
MRDLTPELPSPASSPTLDSWSDMGSGGRCSGLPTSALFKRPPIEVDVSPVSSLKHSVLSSPARPAEAPESVSPPELTMPDMWHNGGVPRRSRRRKRISCALSDASSIKVPEGAPEAVPEAPEAPEPVSQQQQQGARQPDALQPRAEAVLQELCGGANFNLKAEETQVLQSLMSRLLAQQSASQQGTEEAQAFQAAPAPVMHEGLQDGNAATGKAAGRKANNDNTKRRRTDGAAREPLRPRTPGCINVPRPVRKQKDAHIPRPRRSLNANDAPKKDLRLSHNALQLLNNMEMSQNAYWNRSSVREWIGNAMRNNPQEELSG